MALGDPNVSDPRRSSERDDEAGSSAEDDKPSTAQPLERPLGINSGLPGGAGVSGGVDGVGGVGSGPGVEARRKRRKTQPHSSSDIYVSEFLQEEKKNGRLMTSLRDADAQVAKQEFYERLGRVLFLNNDIRDERGDCVVLQSTQNENIIKMSPFTTLMSYFTKPAQMREGKFRALIMAGTQRKCWRPRIYKQQVHVLQDVRYPTTEAEWARVRDLLISAQDGLGQIRLLEEDIDVEHIIVSVREAVQRARDFKFQTPPDYSALASNTARMKPKPSGGFEKPLYPPSGPGNFEKTTHQEWRDQPAQHDQFDIPNFHEADSDEGTNNFHQNVELHVDSQTFVTTEATLLASPEGSFFHMLMSHFPKSKEFYVDRSPAVFEWVLEYLRELKYMEMFANAGEDSVHIGIDSLPLPTDTLKLTQLRRECIFYGLPDLLNLVEKRLRALDSPSTAHTREV